MFSTFVMLILISFLYFFVPLSNLHRRNKFPLFWWNNKKKFLWTKFETEDDK